MKDVAGNDLSVGQKVATTVSGYESLQVGVVYGFSKQKVKIMLNTENGENNDDVMRFPGQVAVLK